MNTQDNWISSTRVLLTLGVGLLLVAAWYGGRITTAGSSPVGMMDGSMHGHGMTTTSGEVFDGETGLRRCRAMMGTMEGMNRSMQSMMGARSGSRSERRQDRRGHMGGGMMDKDMGPMHERMGAKMEEMSPEEMRSLCRTMEQTMQAVMYGEEPEATGGAGETAFEGLALEAETEQWLRNARGFEAVEDRTDEAEVIVEVGAGDGLQYAPAAVRVEPGTTIRWRWTGQGGLHDVAFVNGEVSTSLQGDEGAEFTYTFDAPGTYRYECTPHAGVGMRGVVIVTKN